MQDFGEQEAQQIASTREAEVQSGRSSSAGAGTADAGDIRGVQLTGCCKHAVGVCGNVDKGKADDGAAGAAGGGDIRGVQLAGFC